MKAPRWTRAQLKLYNEKHGTVPIPRRKKPVAGRTAPRRGKNKTEADFEAWFKFQHPSLTILYEAIKLRIDETCSYCPDFFCPETLTFYEVKGTATASYAEDGIIKFKACRALYPCFKWQMWQKRKGNWRQIRKLPGEPQEYC